MTSDEIYVRKDVYAADQRALLAEIRLSHNEILKAFDQFKSEVNSRFDKIDARFDKMEAQMLVVSGRVTNLERQVSSLENFVMIGISFIALLIGLLVFLMPISRLTARLTRRLWKPEESITLKQVEELINAKLQSRQ